MHAILLSSRWAELGLTVSSYLFLLHMACTEPWETRGVCVCVCVCINPSCLGSSTHVC